MHGDVACTKAQRMKEFSTTFLIKGPICKAEIEMTMSIGVPGLTKLFVPGFS
jgi:hypothetical protein